jgi:geranylgeranyl diphosphate synthase, type I
MHKTTQQCYGLAVADQILTATVPRTRSARRSPGIAEAVEAALTIFVSDESAALVALDPALEPLVNAVRDAVLGGGKRLRPLFAFWGWRANGGDGQVVPVLPALSALELLHAFALIHDDVMDRSDTRRGLPTAHRSLAAAHSRAGLRGEALRFGDAAAILAGDLCLVWADRLMGQAQVPPSRLAAARRAYDQMRVEAVAGQFLDILGDCSPTWTVERALRTARLKTAGYTVVQPLQFGSVLAGPVDPMLSAALTRYGVQVGEAFQLRDDLLGAFGDPAVTGKPVGDDLAQGKPTVLLQLARARLGHQGQSELDRLRRDCSRESTDGASARNQLADLVHGTGAADAVQQMIAERVGGARDVVASLPLDREVHQALTGLAETAAWRSA